MARIENTTDYPVKVNPVAADFLIGTDSEDSNKTISFTIESIKSGGAGTGDVSGPTVTIDNTIPRFDGTTGKLIQNSVAILTDAGLLSGVTWNGVTVGAIFGGTGQSAYATGEIIYASATDTLSKLSPGTNGQVLSLVGGIPAWTTETGLGDVVGPVSSTDNALAKFNGTTGDIIQNSVGILTDAGLLSGVTWNGATVGTVFGGTGLNTYSTGEIIFASAANTLSKLSAGTNGQVLTLTAGIPAWSTGVSNTGTPLNNQFSVWTDANTIEGISEMTWDGSDFIMGDINGIFTLRNLTGFSEILASNRFDFETNDGVRLNDIGKTNSVTFKNPVSGNTILTAPNSTGTIARTEDLLVKQVIITQANAVALLGGTIDSTVEYFLDGVVDMGSTSIEVPSGGINIKGYDFNISGLTSSATGYTMFTAPVGGSGDFLWADFKIEVTGTTSQVLDIVGDTGNEAFEIARINFNNCTSLGEIDNYRQGLESGTGRFGGTPSLTLSGAWSGGFFIDTSIVRALTDGSYALYQEGTAFTMQSRFRSNQNIDLNATVAFLNFDAANFPNPNTLQLTDCLVTRNGSADASDTTIIPNITPGDLSSFWKGNTGIPNTFLGGELTITVEVASTITVIGTFVDMAGTFTPNGLEHFDSPSNGQLRHIGDSPREFDLSYDLVIDGPSGDEVQVKIVIFDDSASSFSDGAIRVRQINALVGGRNVAFIQITTNIVLDQNDYAKLQVANATTTSDLTTELDSTMTIRER